VTGVFLSFIVNSLKNCEPA